MTIFPAVTPAVPSSTVGSLSCMLKEIVSRKTPGKIIGGGIGTPNWSSAPALWKPPAQKATPFRGGSGAIFRPAPCAPLAGTRKISAVAFHHFLLQEKAGSP